MDQSIVLLSGDVITNRPVNSFVIGRVHEIVPACAYSVSDTVSSEVLDPSVYNPANWGCCFGFEVSHRLIDNFIFKKSLT